MGLGELLILFLHILRNGLLHVFLHLIIGKADHIAIRTDKIAQVGKVIGKSLDVTFLQRVYIAFRQAGTLTDISDAESQFFSLCFQSFIEFRHIISTSHIFHTDQHRSKPTINQSNYSR